MRKGNKDVGVENRSRKGRVIGCVSFLFLWKDLNMLSIIQTFAGCLLSIEDGGKCWGFQDKRRGLSC